MANASTLAGAKIIAGTPETVAFDLMMKIVKKCPDTGKEQQTKEYWLDLYAECLRATTGKRTKPAS